MEQLINRVLRDRYRIQSLLSRKTGRRTFLAKDLQTQATVIIKLLLFGPDFTWDDLKLFEREAETLKVLEHSSIPQYLDSFEIETELGKGFALVQNYIEARSLQDWIQSGRSFSEAELKAIAKELLEILSYLHDRKPPVIHRDLKPSNILLGDPAGNRVAGRTGNSPGKVYLVDFGSVQTAIHSGTMTIVGTYGYMPPEQFGGRATQLSDLYSLGATIIYLATGQHPAEFMTDDLRLDFQQSTQLSAQFTHWLWRMVQSTPSQRFASAKEALQALNNPQFRETSEQLSPLTKTLASNLKPFARPDSARCFIKKEPEEISITAPDFFRFSGVSIGLFLGFLVLAPILNNIDQPSLASFFNVIGIFAIFRSILQDRKSSIESSYIVLKIDKNEIFLWRQFQDKERESICLKQAFSANIRKVQLVHKDNFYHIKLVTSYSNKDDFLVGNRTFWLSQGEAEWLANELGIWLEMPVTEVQVVEKR
ncbi:serine/threonine-protein kinase [Oscillatoria sp. FACHB-1406]|uniref:serine/threonine protein kinase n=1 Tax=Oscillatoria sp. FACHB-1406 TaxID=2692846 RepID=UPI001684F640|nr:serine/threonine-protein kinase [Oscillatoria sp. FACHB-1406]MBD2578143.1 serine/threonine protein kinase [Oscillatoria sp. FACHB-1406]